RGPLGRRRRRPPVCHLRAIGRPDRVPDVGRVATMSIATDRSAPTLAELRVRVQKARHREIGNWLARRVARPTAIYGTWLAIRLGLSAHAVTLLALASSGAAALAIMAGSQAGFVTGVALAHLAFWLDHVDGQVARWRE